VGLLQGTNLWNFRPEVTVIQNSLARRLQDLVHRGKVNANLFFPCWLLYKISPDISGTYYVFSLAGKYPRTESEAPGYSRRGLRNRIDWAVECQALDELEKPKFTYMFDSKRKEPANAAVAPNIRTWDIPLVAWRNEVLVPTHWDSMGVQIHREPTLRLNDAFVAKTASRLISWGKAVVRILGGTSLDQSLGVETHAIWERLHDILTRQHEDTKRNYKDEVERLGRELEGELQEEAKGVYLAFSLINLHGPKAQKNQSKGS
jgi:hypothetical protein